MSTYVIGATRLTEYSQGILHRCSWVMTNLPFLPDLPNSPALQGGPLVFSFALASKLLSAILTYLSFLPDSPNSRALQGGPLVFSFALASKLLSAILTNLPAVVGGPLVFSFALACKLLSAILTYLPFLPDSPNSPALQGGPLVFSFALASKLFWRDFAISAIFVIVCISGHISHGKGENLLHHYEEATKEFDASKTCHIGMDGPREI